MRRVWLALLICALFIPASAAAQVRNIPDEAKRGSIVRIQDSVIEIDGTQLRLSAGAKVLGQNNLIIMPISLQPGSLVKYTLDGTGQIYRVWVLTAEEAAAPDKKP
jgi:hypothetical protein